MNTDTPRNHLDEDTERAIRDRLILLALLAVPVGVLGFVASFAGVSKRFEPWQFAWTVPLVVDLCILVCSLSLFFGAQVRLRQPLTRPVLYGAIGVTVYLNWSIGSTAWERIGHAVAPAVYAFIIELGSAWARHLLNLQEPPAEHVPAAVWLLRLPFAFAVQRLMWVTGERSYVAALAAHERHALARAEINGADPAKLAKIRLRYFSVRPSVMALTAGDGVRELPAGDTDTVSSQAQFGDVSGGTLSPSLNDITGDAAEPSSSDTTERPRKTPRVRVPKGRSATDEQITQDLAAWALVLADKPSLRSVMDRYKIGEPRARKVIASVNGSSHHPTT